MGKNRNRRNSTHRHATPYGPHTERKEKMEEKNINDNMEARSAETDSIEEVVPGEVEETDNIDTEAGPAPTGDTGTEALRTEIEELKAQVEKEKKEYLFLMAEFDNFRKRTLKEKSEIIKNAGEGVFKGLLPIVDDMERGLKASEGATDVESVREGMRLIYNKLVKYLNANGVKEIDPADDNFDTERHEAISMLPVADEDKKGKILDTVEKGYTINDKVLRHAKVVVAAK